MNLGKTPFKAHIHKMTPKPMVQNSWRYLSHQSP